MRAALLLLALASWPSAKHDRPPPTWVHGAAARSGAGDIPLFDQLVFTGSAQRTPEQICLAGDAGRCVACGVGLIDGGACSWQCRNQDGTSAGTVVNEVGSTCVDTFISGAVTGAVRAMEITTPSPTLYNDGGLLDTFVRDGGMVSLWGYSRGGPSGFDYWLTDNNDTGCALIRQNGGTMTFALTSYYSPIDGNNVLNGIEHNGYGIMIGRYTAGADAGAGPAATMVFDYNAAANKFGNTSVFGPGGDCGSPWYFGGRRAGDLYLNGPLGGVTFWQGDKGNDGAAYIEESFYGMPSQHSYANRWISTLALPTGIDNTARTGNVDVINGSGFLVSPEGVEGTDSQGTNWCGGTGGDALDLTGTVATGTGTLTTDVSRGPFAAYKNAPECDRLFDNDGTNFYCRWLADAGVPYTTWGWNLSVYPKASDGGPTTDQLHLVMQTNGIWQSDGGHLAICDFSGLVYDAGRYECRDKMNPDSGTYVVAGICVGNTAGAKGTIEICQRQFTNSLALEPPVVDQAIRTAGDQSYAPWPSSWPNFDGGTVVAVELVSEIPYDPSGDWTTNNDVDYPLDITQTGTYGLTDHSTTVIYGYTVPGLELVANRDTSGAGSLAEDFQIPGVSFARWHTVATRFQVSKRATNGIKCGAVVKQADCGVQPGGLSAAAAQSWLQHCSATATIATNTDVDAGCPGLPGYITVTGRNNGSIVSTTKVKAIRLLVRP